MNAPSRSSADTARPGSDEQDAPASPAQPQGEREADAPLRDALFWLEAALRCPSFEWDSDQREYAQAALDQSRASLSASTPSAVPADVLAALDRMCTPLDESWLKGATAEADARCMKLIRDYVLGASPPADNKENGNG